MTMPSPTSESSLSPFARQLTAGPLSVLLPFWAVLLLALPMAGVASAAPPDSGTPTTDLFPKFSLGKYGPDGTDAQEDPYQLQADYVASDQAAGRLTVRVRISLREGWHVYSLTQPAGGPLPTKLELRSPDAVKQTGQWQPSELPTPSVSPEFGGITIEEHGGKVTFSVTAEPAEEGVKVESLGPIEVLVKGLACTTGGACLPIEETLTAKYAGEDPAPATGRGEQPTSAGSPTVREGALPARGNRWQTSPSPNAILDQIAGPRTGGRKGVDTDSSQPTGETAPSPVDDTAQGKAFRDEDYVVQWQASLHPSSLTPGQRGTLRVTAIPDAEFHVYTAAVDAADAKTNFVVTEKSGLRIGPPQTDAAAVDYELLPGVTYHPGKVTWQLPIEVPADATEGVRNLRGAIAYQACQETSCQQPTALRFAVDVPIRTGEQDTADNADGKAFTAVRLEPADRIEVLDQAATNDWVDQKLVDEESSIAPDGESGGPAPPSDAGGTLPFSTTLLFALIGGVILNFMPCVLPVVGLKVMSFVQQAGENRGRVFMLNLVYSLGILSVFAVLTVLAVLLSFSWGEQFTYFPVRLGLTLLMFAMALSYLGVWEIPVPGMAAGHASQSLQKREGYSGAFFKGVFATVLATPCSGPLLGGILGLTFALAGWQTALIIMTVGVGMALPYLIIGVWPKLVAWLPKPGTWMETLKEFLAFLFLGTVAFFFNQFSDDHKLPVFVSLIGVWFGCWIIGKVPNWANLQPRLVSWAGGVAAATVIGMAAFHYLGPESTAENAEPSIAWQPYSEERLEELQAEGRTVLVDFTAKWCVNCIVNYNVAINTEPTRQLIEELDAVPMLADWTDRDASIKAKLEELQSRSIPLLAIYPGRAPEDPIVLRDLVSQQAVLDALQQAGPSRTGIPDAATTAGKKAAGDVQWVRHSDDTEQQQGKGVLLPGSSPTL